MTMYDKDYFERGEELGISGYTDYRWLPDLTIPMAKAIAKATRLPDAARVLDYGCAKGFMVKAFRELGYAAYGVDVSQYALSQAPEGAREYAWYVDPEVPQSVLPAGCYDLIIAKDVFEHIHESNLLRLIPKLSAICESIFVVVPLGKDGAYIAPEYERDVTHVVRRPLDWWAALLNDNGFDVQWSKYRVKGIKDAWARYRYGNGFILARSRMHGGDA
jgi:SAM-dependent methyltransferase